VAELGLAARLAAVVFTALVAEGVRRADRAAAEGRFSRAFADGLWLGAWLGAALLLANLLRTPANDFSVLAAASALAFAALAGAALSRLSAAGRAAVVAGASLLVVGRLAGFAALAMNLGACLPAFALVRWVAPHRPRLAASLEAALFIGLVAMLHRLRLHGVMAGLAAWSLFAFVSLRHVSFAVSSRRTPGTSLVQYLSYLLFFSQLYRCDGGLPRVPRAQFGGAGAFCDDRGNPLDRSRNARARNRDPDRCFYESHP